MTDRDQLDAAPVVEADQAAPVEADDGIVIDVLEFSQADVDRIVEKRLAKERRRLNRQRDEDVAHAAREAARLTAERWSVRVAELESELKALRERDAERRRDAASRALRGHI